MSENRMADKPSAADAKPRPSAWKRRLWRIVLRILFLYLLIAVMLGFLQRSLIYLPTRAGSIHPAESHLPAGCVHDITFETIDGLQLHGWHVLANGRRCQSRDECDRELASGRLLVLFFHGNGGDRRGRTYDCQIFSGLNADVFIIDYRGYGENAGSPHEQGLADDARAVWKYATEERNVSPERIVLFGESLGGGVAIGLAAEVCDAGTPPAGVMVRSTFSSLTDTAAYHYPWLPVRMLLRDRYPSSERISALTCPYLHIHGARDRIIPIQLGRKLFDAAPQKSANGIAKRFVELPNAGHNDLLFRAEAEFRDAVGKFFETLRNEQ